MLKKVSKFIESQKLFAKDDLLICATSGGVDSVCLIHILVYLGYKVVLAHVNHHKRIEADLEQVAMDNLAKSLNIPFELYHFHQEGQDNFQNQAHHARYAFFKSLAHKYQTKYIITAHHLDDQAETILMRLLQGSNLYGYAGIAIKQDLDDITLVRPLLCVSKAELYTYAKENKYLYFEDQSNQLNTYLRNRIRHNILPSLKKENPNFLNQIEEFSIQTREAFNYIRKKSISYLNKQNNIISIAEFKSFDIALKKDILCLLFEKNNLAKSFNVIEACLALIEKAENGQYTLKDEHFLIVEYGLAKIAKKKTIISQNKPITLEQGCKINHYYFYFSKNVPQSNAKYLKLCYNNLKLPFFARTKKDGDFIQLNCGNKKVSRVFIDSKIPKEEREVIPLIYDNEGNLLWVYNLAKSENVVKEKDNGDIFLVCEEKSND